MPRPRFTPTEEQRRLVKSLSAYGVPQEQIAWRIDIRSAKTLRKHFRKELDGGALEANTSVVQTLYKMATSGEHPGATVFWLKCRAGWKESHTSEPIAVSPPPFIVAKEEGVQLQ
jgi:hypothetical protein